MEFDHLGLLLQHVVSLDLIGVEVDRSHVVDDDGDLARARFARDWVTNRRGLAKDFLEQGGLTGAEEAGEHGERE